MARQKVKGISISSANATGSANATSGYVLKADGSGGAAWSADTVVDGITYNAGSSISFDIDDTEHMTLTSNGKLNVKEIAHLTSGNLEIGNGDEKQIFDASGATIQFQTGDSERVRIDANGRLLVGKNSSTSPELGGSQAIGEFVGSASGRLNVLRLSNSYTVSTGTASSAILFGAHTNGARDNAVIEVQNTANGGDAIEFQIHLRNSSNSMIENFTMRHDGDIHLNQTRSDSHLYIGSEGGSFGGNSSNWMRASSSSLMFNAPTQQVFEIAGTNKASITSSGGGGIFSDRDMKENIADIDIGLSEV